MEKCYVCLALHAIYVVCFLWFDEPWIDLILWCPRIVNSLKSKMSDIKSKIGDEAVLHARVISPIIALVKTVFCTLEDAWVHLFFLGCFFSTIDSKFGFFTKVWKSLKTVCPTKSKHKLEWISSSSISSPPLCRSSMKFLKINFALSRRVDAILTSMSSVHLPAWVKFENLKFRNFWISLYETHKRAKAGLTKVNP